MIIKDNPCTDCDYEEGSRFCLTHCPYDAERIQPQEDNRQIYRKGAERMTFKEAYKRLKHELELSDYDIYDTEEAIMDAKNYDEALKVALQALEQIEKIKDIIIQHDSDKMSENLERITMKEREKDNQTIADFLNEIEPIAQKYGWNMEYRYNVETEDWLDVFFIPAIEKGK